MPLTPPAPEPFPTEQSLVPIPPGRIPAAIAALDDIIREVLERTGVPGLAVSVVHKGKTVYAKGFGVRNVDTGARVDKRTIFQMASVSKSISATVVAGVVGRELVSWIDPLEKHLPGFALADPYVSQHVTIRDMFSHQSGLPDHAGDLLEDLGYDQAYILNRLRMEHLAPFRANYDYTNFGLTAGAVSAAAAAGKAWPDLAEDVLYRPLGMTSTSSRHSDFANAPNHADLHVRINGKWEQKFERDPDPEAPAGGVSSNVIDLARWMILRLAGGVWQGSTLIDPTALAETQLPLVISNPPGSLIARTGFYGCGTNVGYDYAGRLRLTHSGAFASGAATSYALLPSEDLGIMVITNGMPIGVPEAISFYFLDLIESGGIQQDWLALYQQAFAGLSDNPSELAGQQPPAHPTPAHPDNFYTGAYDNAYYGPIQVVSRRGGLHVLIGPRPDDYPLQHWDGDLFAFYPTGENAVGISAATFTPNATGTAAASLTLEYYNWLVQSGQLTTSGLGVFTRH